jgi:hypothetical protein
MLIAPVVWSISARTKVPSGMDNSILTTRRSMIATVPRSGTWMLKYFFAAFEMVTLDEDPVLESVYANTRDPIADLERGLSMGPTFIGHSPLPSFSASPQAHSSGWLDLLAELGCADAVARQSRRLNDHGLDTNPNARIVFVYRDPLDLFAAYGRRHADMVAELARAASCPLGL